MLQVSVLITLASRLIVFDAVKVVAMRYVPFTVVLEHAPPEPMVYFGATVTSKVHVPPPPEAVAVKLSVCPAMGVPLPVSVMVWAPVLVKTPLPEKL